MPDAKKPNLYYPDRSNYANHQQWQDAVQLFDHMHSNNEKAEKAAPSSTTPAAPAAGGATNTTIAGIPVSGSPSSANPNLKFNPASGQLEWVP